MLFGYRGQTPSDTTSQARVFYLRSGSGEDPGSLWSREPPDFRGNSNCRLFAT